MSNTVIKMSTMDLDSQFAQDLHILSKMATTNHPWAKFCISRHIERYIEKKIDLELTNSISTIFKQQFIYE